jgi:SSS family transporter
LAPLDIAIVLVYILGTTLVGVWFTRRQRDLRTYFVGDRNVAWWLVLISIVTTETSVVTFLSVPGRSFGGDLTFLQLALGYMAGRVLIAWLLLPQYLRGELFSAYQVLRQRFGPAVQRTASGLFLLTRTVADGLRLYLAGLLLQHCTGWGLAPSILAMAGVTVVYTYCGGMKAVIWTDVIQFVLKVGGGVVAAVVILALLPGGWDTFWAEGDAAGKFGVFDFSTVLNGPDITFWAGLLGGAFFTMASHGADQMMVQRYLCSRSLGQARAALVLSGVVVFFQFWLFLLVGVGLWVLARTGGLEVPAKTPNDAVFGIFIVEKLPVGLVGLVIAAVLAAAMSTLSSSLNSSASASVADFYRPLRPGKDEGHYLLVSRGLTLLWGGAQTTVALLAAGIQGQDKSVVDSVLSVAGLTTGMILGLFVLGMLRRRVSSAAALAGLVVGFAVVLTAWVPLTFPNYRAYAWLSYPWFAALGTLVTVAVALVVDFVSNRHVGSLADRGAQPRVGEPR